MIAILAGEAPGSGEPYPYLLPLLPAYTAFQIVPLPTSWVVALSPARAQAFDALAAIVAKPEYSTISVFPTARGQTRVSGEHNPNVVHHDGIGDRVG